MAMATLRRGTPINVKYTHSAPVVAGDIIAGSDGRLRIARADIAANVEGEYAISGGIWEIAKPSGALTRGLPMFWDVAAAQIQNDQDNGTNYIFGYAHNAPASGDATAEVEFDPDGLRSRLRTLSHFVADPAADADLAATAIGAAPLQGGTVLSASLVLFGNTAGIDGSNTCAVTISDGAGNTIVTKTYGATPPTDAAINDLGAIDATHGVLTGGECVRAAVVNGTTANLPAYAIVVTILVDA